LRLLGPDRPHAQRESDEQEERVSEAVTNRALPGRGGRRERRL